MVQDAKERMTKTTQYRAGLVNYPWMKLYTDMLSDPVFMRFSDAQVATYIKLLLQAGRCDAGGFLGFRGRVWSIEDIAFEIRVSVEYLQPVMDDLIKAGFMGRDGEGYVVNRFLEEQGPGMDADRAKWSQRQALHREKLKGGPQINSPQESQKIVEKDSNTEIEADKDKEEECHRDKTNCHGDITVTHPKPNEFDRLESFASAYSASYREFLYRTFKVEPTPSQLRSIDEYQRELGSKKIPSYLKWAAEECNPPMSLNDALENLRKKMLDWMKVTAGKGT